MVEAADRVRRALGFSQNDRHQRPLIVVVTKADAWGHLLQEPHPRAPWRGKNGLAGLEVEWIDQRSAELRSLLVRVCPEVVRAAESFADNVVYIPVSALGREPVADPTQNVNAIRPVDIQPSWVTTPLLYGLCRWLPGLIPAVRHAKNGATRSGTMVWWRQGSAP